MEDKKFFTAIISIIIVSLSFLFAAMHSVDNGMTFYDSLFAVWKGMGLGIVAIITLIAVGWIGIAFIDQHKNKES